VDLLLSKDRIIQAPGRKTDLQHFGVKYPSAINEATITIYTKVEGVKTSKSGIIMKVDSGASVSLAHPDFLTDIKDCKIQGLPPVRLNGIGGNTGIMTKVGILNIIKISGEVLKVKCYAFDTAIGNTTHLCLLSNWAIDHYQIDQAYHAHTSLRIGPQRLRFKEEKPMKALRLQSRNGHRVAQGLVEDHKIMEKYAQGKRLTKAQKIFAKTIKRGLKNLRGRKYFQNPQNKSQPVLYLRTGITALRPPRPRQKLLQRRPSPRYRRAAPAYNLHLRATLCSVHISRNPR
jgi:hypothetical protein